MLPAVLTALALAMPLLERAGDDAAEANRVASRARFNAVGVALVEAAEDSGGRGDAARVERAVATVEGGSAALQQELARVVLHDCARPRRLNVVVRTLSRSARSRRLCSVPMSNGRWWACSPPLRRLGHGARPWKSLRSCWTGRRWRLIWHDLAVVPLQASERGNCWAPTWRRRRVARRRRRRRRCVRGPATTWCDWCGRRRRRWLASWCAPRLLPSAAARSQRAPSTRRCWM